MNENKCRNRQSIGWENVLNKDYKNNTGRNFQLKKSHLLTLTLLTEEIFKVNGQNRPVANLLVVDFHSQPREMPTPKPLNTWLSVFSFFILVYPKSLNLSLSAIRIFQCLSRHNPRTFRQTTLYWESWRLCRSFIKLTERRQRRVTFQQLISYINTREKIRYFFTCVVTAFLRAGNPCITPQFMWQLLLLRISKYLARTRHHVTFCMPNLTVVIMRFLYQFIDKLNYYDIYIKTVNSFKSALQWLSTQTPNILCYSSPSNSRGICAEFFITVT